MRTYRTLSSISTINGGGIGRELVLTAAAEARRAGCTDIARPRSTTRVSLPPGGTLLYADGLIERRDRHLDDDLTESLAVAPGWPPPRSTS